jgi:hypothetical protein
MTINYDKTNLRNKFEGNFSFWMFVLIWVKLQCYKKIKEKLFNIHVWEWECRFHTIVKPDKLHTKFMVSLTNEIYTCIFFHLWEPNNEDIFIHSIIHQWERTEKRKVVETRNVEKNLLQECNTSQWKLFWLGLKESYEHKMQNVLKWSKFLSPIWIWNLILVPFENLIWIWLWLMRMWWKWKTKMWIWIRNSECGFFCFVIRNKRGLAVKKKEQPLRMRFLILVQLLVETRKKQPSFFY